jgi:hypothetical protein
VTLSSYHIDHMPPNTFSVLVGRWFAEVGVGIDDVGITPLADNQYVVAMTNEWQRSNWASFHEAHASLRLLSPMGNLSDARIR